MIAVNKALNALTKNGGGPVHIDIAAMFGQFSQKDIKAERVIRTISQNDIFPELPKRKIAVMVGSHKKFSERLGKSLDFILCYK